MILAAILLIGMMGLAIYKTRQIPESISEISYIIPKWLFCAGIMLIGMLLMPNIAVIFGVKYAWLGFLIGTGLWCVAVSPYYKTEYSWLHYSGAVLCFLSALGLIVISNPWYLLLWLVYPVFLIKKIRKWWLLGAECLCFL